jgi:hypothetical protein
MRIGIKVIDARGVEGAGAPNDAMNFVAFLEQQFGQITSVLAGDTGNQRLSHERRLALAHGMPAGKLLEETLNAQRSTLN